VSGPIYRLLEACRGAFEQLAAGNVETAKLALRNALNDADIQLALVHELGGAREDKGPDIGGSARG
jgi:hypothetical protein